MNKSLLRKSRAYYKINPAYSNCPSCKSSGTLMKSHSRNFGEKILNNVTILRYYRCKQCGWRGLLRTVKFTSASLGVVVLYLLLVSGAALITYQILKRLL